MDGLECSEVMLSDIDLSDRCDSEYYTKDYLMNDQILSHCKTEKISQLCKTTASAFYPAATHLYEFGDFPFVRCVDCIDYPIITPEQDSNFEKIPLAFAEKSSGISILKNNDIVITKVGTPCYTSIIDGYSRLALSRTVLGLTNVKNINPYYL